MPRLLFPALLLLCAFATAQNQQSTTKQDPADLKVFRVNVNLVQVDAVVTDKDGRPVTDLTAEDFVVLQDGKSQEITNFSLVRMPPPVAPPPAAQKRPSKPEEAAPVPQIQLTPDQVRRVVALVVDDLGLSFDNTVRSRDAIKKWVDEEMQPGDLVAVITTGFGMGGLQQFTGDKQLLYSAIDRIRFNIISRVGSDSYGDEPSALSSEQQEERNRGLVGGTMGAIRYAVNGMENLPGRKSLILFSENLGTNFDAFAADDADAVFSMNLSDSAKDGLRNLVQDANRAAVVVHTIDPRGSAWGSHIENENVTAGSILASREGLIGLSQETGGLFIQHHNLVDVALQEAARDGEIYYLIGYRPDAKTVAEMQGGQQKYHEIKVRVKRRGLQVRSRSGFFSTTEDRPYAPAPKADSLAQAMLSPLKNDDLMVSLSSGYVCNPEGKYFLRVWVHLPGRQLTILRDAKGGNYVSLETYAATTDFTGLVRDSDRMEHKVPLSTQEVLSVREHGFRFTVTIPAKDPGTYFVRLAVKDQGSGKIGSAYRYIKIPDLKKEGLALSDLFAISGVEDARLILSETDEESPEQSYSNGQDRGESPAVRQYQPGESFEYMALIYNADTRQGKPPDLETRTVLYRDGSEIFRSDPEDVDLGGVSDPARIPVKKRLRLGKTMQPGDYILQLQVRDKRGDKKHSLATSFIDFTVIPEKEPTNLEKAETLIVKGNEAERAGRKEEAIQAFEETARLYREELRHNPDDTVLWKQTGTVYFLAGDTDQAAAAYEEAVRLNPEDAESHYMLAIIHASIDVDSAIGDFREAIGLNPENAKYHFDMGRALAQKRDFAAAIEAFREASRLNPEDGESRASLGIVLEQTGEIEAAAAEYREALTLKLSDESADSVRRLLKKVLAETEGEDAEKRREYITLKVKRWRSAVEQHIPGKSDAAAVEVGSWPVNDLDIIISLIGNTREGKLQPIVEGSLTRLFKGRQYIEENILPSLILPDNENQLLKRAAVLHTDIAMFQLDTGHFNEENVIYRGIVYKKDKDDAITVQDGRGTGQSKGWHWEFARYLLDQIAPNPSEDETVRKWYVAATAFMLFRRQFGDAEDNLASALELFPSDPALLFYSGALHENYAAPSFQNALQPDGMAFGFNSENLELKQAAEYFRKALDIRPEFSEARLHLGRVLGLSGNHESAAEELQKAAASLADTQLRYYCALYLANELAALNRGKDARVQFQTAAELYPKAQAPLLGLSRLSLSSGDYENALFYGNQIFSLPAEEDASEDPWWDYNVSPALNAPALISEMYEALGGLSP